jgi:hypothetical protein
MQESKIRTLRIICLLGLVATIAAVAAIPLVVIPTQHRSENYCLKITWAEFLSVVVWLGLYGFLSTPLQPERARMGRGGIAPAFALGAIVYAAVSFALLVAQSALTSNEFVGRVLLAAQILLTAACVVVGLLIRVTGIFTDSKPTNPTPSRGDNKQV